MGHSDIHFLFLCCPTRLCCALYLQEITIRRALVSWLPGKVREEDSRAGEMKPRYLSTSDPAGLAPPQAGALSLPWLQFPQSLGGPGSHQAAPATLLAPVGYPSFWIKGTIPFHSPRWSQIPFIWLLFYHICRSISSMKFPLLKYLEWFLFSLYQTDVLESLTFFPL